MDNGQWTIDKVQGTIENVSLKQSMHNSFKDHLPFALNTIKTV